MIRDRAGSKPLLLLVEDHEDTRLMYGEFLGDTFEISEADRAGRALELMRERRPDVVITDLSLPDIDGFELVARMRRDPALQDVPVICLSGYGGAEHENRARAVGCDVVLQKPCMPDVLKETAVQVVGAGRSSSGAVNR